MINQEWATLIWPSLSLPASTARGCKSIKPYNPSNYPGDSVVLLFSCLSLLWTSYAVILVDSVHRDLHISGSKCINFKQGKRFYLILIFFKVNIVLSLWSQFEYIINNIKLYCVCSVLFSCTFQEREGLYLGFVALCEWFMFIRFPEHKESLH